MTFRCLRQSQSAHLYIYLQDLALRQTGTAELADVPLVCERRWFQVWGGAAGSGLLVPLSSPENT